MPYAHSIYSADTICKYKNLIRQHRGRDSQMTEWASKTVASGGDICSSRDESAQSIWHIAVHKEVLMQALYMAGERATIQLP